MVSGLLYLGYVSTCSVDNCELPPRGRGLCKGHYQQARRKGTLPPLEDKSQHLLSNIDREDKTGDCSVCGLGVELRITRRTVACKVRHRATERRRYRVKKYGLTDEDFARLVSVQNDQCAICKETGLRLVVDHCHQTGRVRGLLCDPCNTGLGFFRDQAGRLLEAVKYLAA